MADATGAAQIKSVVKQYGKAGNGNPTMGYTLTGTSATGQPVTVFLPEQGFTLASGRAAFKAEAALIDHLITEPVQ